jgi:hypothetical protein
MKHKCKFDSYKFEPNKLESFEELIKKLKNDARNNVLKFIKQHPEIKSVNELRASRTIIQREFNKRPISFVFKDDLFEIYFEAYVNKAESILRTNSQNTSFTGGEEPRIFQSTMRITQTLKQASLLKPVKKHDIQDYDIQDYDLDIESDFYSQSPLGFREEDFGMVNVGDSNQISDDSDRANSPSNFDTMQDFEEQLEESIERRCSKFMLV